MGGEYQMPDPFQIEEYRISNLSLLMRQLCPVTDDEEGDDEFIEDASEAADEDD